MSTSPVTPLISGRFRTIRVLKLAAGVETLLAEDGAGEGNLVVVKRAPVDSIGSAVAARLQHEATVLSRLGGVTGPVAVTSGTDDGSFWLAQAFLPGETLARRLASGPLTVDIALGMVVDVLAQLSQAHDLGVLHRDVKPANIMLSPGLGATLIDFGLARNSWLDPEIRDQAVGTARYLSPEQAGLIDLPVDGRSDLYSLGVVLFESLAGRPPFDGTDVGTLLRQHHSAPAPDLRALGVRAPRAVCEVVDRLLRKDPSERYQSAAAVLTDLEAIEAARRSGVVDPRIVVGRTDRRTTLTEASFVGRDRELLELLEVLGQAGPGTGGLATSGLAIVEGESGSGKSRLLEELAHAAAERGTWVLRGQGVDQVAPRPFELLDGVAAGVVDAVAADPEVGERLRRRLGLNIEPVSSALPRLAGALSADGGAALPEEYGENRSLAAMAAFLDALGERPVLVILDDCQWAPRVTARVIAQWRRRRRAGRPVMVVASFRAEDVPEASPLRSLHPDAWVTLGPLAPRDVADLVASMGGPVPAEAVATVHRLSEGNPFMAEAVLRGMVECGALVNGPDGWGLDPLSHGEVQASRRAALFLMRRLDLLSPPARSLLEVGAILGKEFDLGLATSLSGLAPDAAAAALDDARRRRILWVDAAGGRARFLHDKLREAVLSGLDNEVRRGLHLRAAEALQGLGQLPEAAAYASDFDLAYHFDAAGSAEQALPYALRAARQARAQHALDIAGDNYLIATRGATGSGPAVQALAAEGLGDVLALRGRYAEAESHLEKALQLSDNSVRRAALEGKLGDVAFRRGEQGKACQLLEGALGQLGHRVPRRPIGFLPGLAWAVIVQSIHTLVPALVGRASGPPTEAETLTMRLYSRLAYAYWFRSGLIACGWAHLRGMNLAERFPPSPELAQAYSEHAPVMTMIPWYSRGLDYARRSLAMRTELGDVWGQGQSRHFYGVVLYAASRYRESLASCEEAVQLLARTGDQWEMNTATWHAAFAHYRLGELRRAVAISSKLHADADEIGDQASAGIALSGWSRAAIGRIPQGVVADALARENEDVHTASEVRLAEAVRRLAVGDQEGAVAVLDVARGEIRRARLRQEYVAPVLPWLATALRSQIESLDAADPARRALVARNRRAARAACRLAASYRNNLPHALRERSLSAAAAGRPRGAMRFVDRSIAVARAQEAAYELAQSQVARGRLGLVLGWPGAAGDLRAGEEAATALGAQEFGTGPIDGQSDVPITLARADRFAALLNAGRTIAAATSVAAIRQAVAEAVPAVLRADHCSVVALPQDRPPELPAGAGAVFDDLSRSVFRQAVETGQLVTAAPGQTGDVADSLVLSGARSVLCAPISRGGRVVSCLYAHRDMGGVFGDEERRLASFIAAVAGATMEHVAGSEAHFRGLVRNSHDLIVVTDPGGRILYVSPSITRVLGYAATEFEALGPVQVFREDDREGVANALRLARFSPAAHPTMEVQAQHRDGSWRWLEVTISNLLSDPSIRGMVLNIRDITDRKQAELALLQATEEFRVSFENAPIGMALTSIAPATAGQWLRVNQALADMLGCTRDEMVGRNFREFTHPDDLGDDEAALDRFCRNEAVSFTTVKRYRHSAGHWIWVQLQTNMAGGDNGPRDYVVSQVLDITERRAAEERLTFLALHDPLTGLANRRLLDDRLARALGRSERSGHQVGVLYIDLDGFKAINDSWGHDRGDQLLLQVTARLREHVRDTDTLARLGGDEFVLVADELTSPDQAAGIARRIEESFGPSFDVPGAGEIVVRASVGIALAQPGADATTLLRHADIAMYQAKERGRGTASPEPSRGD